MNIHIRIRKRIRTPNRLTFLLFLMIVFAVYFLLNFAASSSEDIRGLESPPQEGKDVILPPLQEFREIIPPGKTLSDILGSYEFSPADIHKLREETKPVYDLAKVRAGNELRLFTYEGGQLAAIEYDITSETYLSIRNLGDDFSAEIKEHPIEVHTKFIWGHIEGIPINAVIDQGENPQLAIILEEIFSWDVDFHTDVRSGDSFKIVFEKKYLKGEFIGYGRVLAAEFSNQGKVFQAFRYTYPDTRKSDYFAYDGGSLRKQFLKSPLKSPRITSRFSARRLHPVRRIYRPHYGVDYGARVGTPVFATGEGTVTFAGWNGASGRMLRIRHKKGYETMYLHLRRFASGIRVGAKVTSGRKIAEVGASGEVNGPHLDYRIKHHGKYINPLAARFDPADPLRREFMDDFREKADYYRLALDTPLLALAVFRIPFPTPESMEFADL